MPKARNLLLFLVFSLAALFEPGSAGAHPQTRNGFLVGFGVGGGSAGVDIPQVSDFGFTDGRNGGVSGNFRIGYAFRPDLAVHLETSSWLKEEDDITLTLSVVSAAVTFYPKSSGFFVRGGVGFGTSWFGFADSLLVLGDVTVTKNETGFGLLGAAGYELRLTPMFAMGPQVEYAYLFVEGDFVDAANVVSGSLQFTWYW